MIYIIIAGGLLAASVAWLWLRSSANRSYVKGRYRAPEPDGRVDAEEAALAEQMKVRYEYYLAIREHPPEISYLGETILASDDFEAARSAVSAYEAWAREHPSGKPLKALVILKETDYRSVWFLNGLSDIAKATIYEEFHGEAAYLPTYGMLVVRAGDLEGLARGLNRILGE